MTTAKRIQFNRADKDYSAYYDDNCIGTFATYHQAEIELDAHALDLLERGLVDTVEGITTMQWQAPRDVVYARPAEVVELLHSAGPTPTGQEPGGSGGGGGELPLLLAYLEALPAASPAAAIEARTSETTDTPEVPTGGREEAAPALTATCYVSAGWDGSKRDDLAAIAAQVLLPLAHLHPALNQPGNYLMVSFREEIPVPRHEYALMAHLIDRLNEVAAQLPVRPCSITAHMHIGAEHYVVGHNGPPLPPTVSPDPATAPVAPDVLRRRALALLSDWKDSGAPTEMDAALVRLARALAPPAPRTLDHICGEALAYDYCKAPRKFLARFDTFGAPRQAAVTHAVATWLGCEAGEVDQLWVESRERLGYENAAPA